MPRSNQGPYLSDRPNEFGVYEIRWTEDGRSKRKSTGQADRRAAQRVYAEFLLAAADGDSPTGGSQILIGQCIDAYLKDKKNVADPRTQALDFAHLRAHFADIPVADLDQDDADRYVEARAKGLVSWTDEGGKVRGGRCAKPSSTRGELTMLLTSITHCIKAKKFKAPDGRSLLKPEHRPVIDLPAASAPRDRWLTRAEASTFLAECAVHEPCTGEDPARLTRLFRYAAVMFFTGARRTSVVKLAWPRIVLEHDEAKHAEGVYGLINFRAPGEPVTRKRRGWVPVAAELYPILAQAEKEKTGDWFLDEPIAPYHSWVRAAGRAGLVDEEGGLVVTPHVLRHTFATLAAQDGVPLYDVAGVLHDTLATVEKIYAHHCPGHLRGAVNRKMLVAA